MNDSNFQRDVFIEEIFQAARKDRDIFFVSADFGAPSLDQFREELPLQFLHSGISEQHMIDMAAGFALREHASRRALCVWGDARTDAPTHAHRARALARLLRPLLRRRRRRWRRPVDLHRHRLRRVPLSPLLWQRRDA